jgi:hypothetical protein
MLRKLELYSVITGTMLCSALFVCACIAPEFTVRDASIFGAMAVGCGIG